MAELRPIIATLIVDKEAQAKFQRLRDRYYPAARTPAHVTLFRHLPEREPEEVAKRIREITKGIAPFPIEVTAPMSMSNGVALELHAPELIALRARIAEEYSAHLRREDKKPFAPHMTVQNRVTRRRAQRTLGSVRGSFTPFTATCEGIALWFYMGGPWAPLDEILFED